MTTMTREYVTESSVHDISHIIGSWREGGRPSTRAVLLERPELRDCASVVVQLAHEEYCLRREAGELVAASTFCELFPTIRGKLRQLLEVEDALFDVPLDESPRKPEIIWPDIDSTFLDFELLSMLGKGAAARVYLARQRNLGNRYVALKVSRFGGSEAETLGKLQHRHVVPVLSVHFEPHQQLTAVCMPYLGGSTLSEIRDRAFQGGQCAQSARVILDTAQDCKQVGEFIRGETPADPRLHHGSYVDGIVHLIAELADGLAYTHANQVMHRDLKPSNVLVTPQGCPMLLDFNLSWDGDLEVSRMGGTLPYMPPEQIYATFFADAIPLENDPRSDIWSLGVILFELLTGELPFATTNSTKPESLHKLLEAHSRGIPDIRERNPDVSEGLAQLIARCLDPVADMRPPTAADLAAQLRDLLPLASDPIGPEAQVRRRDGVFRGILAAAVIFAVATPIAGRWFSPVPDAPVPVAIESRTSLMHQAAELASTAKSREDFRALLQLVEEAREWGSGPSLAVHEAFCHFRLRNFAKATMLLQSDSEFDEDPDLRNNVGYCYLNLGDPEMHAAKQSFDSALRLDPNHPQALLNRALCNVSLAKQNYQDADCGVAYLERALEAFSDRQADSNATLMLMAARIYALRARNVPETRDSDKEKVRYFLERAHELGIDPGLVRGQGELKPVFQETWFEERFGHQAATNASEPSSGMDWSTFYVAPRFWE